LVADVAGGFFSFRVLIREKILAKLNTYRFGKMEGYFSLAFFDFARLVVFDELIAPYIEEELRVRVKLHTIFAINSIRAQM